MGRSLDDLPPQTRRLLQLIDPFVAGEARRQDCPRADIRFTRRTLREASHWATPSSRCIWHGWPNWIPGHPPHQDQRLRIRTGLRPHQRRRQRPLPRPGRYRRPAQAYDAARSGANAVQSAPAGPRSGAGRRAVGPGSAGVGMVKTPPSQTRRSLQPIAPMNTTKRLSSPPKKAAAGYPPRPVYTQTDIPFAAAGN